LHLLGLALLRSICILVLLLGHMLLLDHILVSICSNMIEQL
jgi:hypothetical protein